MVRARRIRRENLKEPQYRKRYVRSLEGKGAEWDGDNNVEHMWEQVKWAMVESAREVCGSVRVGEKNQKSVCWNDETKAAVRRRRLLGGGCWQLAMKRKKKDVRKCTERRRVRLKAA